MGYFQAALYATVLEDTITEFRILDECNNELRITKARFDYFKLRSEKFGITEKKTDGNDVLVEKKYDREVYTLNKLIKDRKFILKVLKDTYLGLTLDESFNNLTQTVEDIIAHDKYFYTLEEEEAKNKQLLRDLRRQLRLQRNHNMAANYDTDALINKLKANTVDYVFVAEARSHYMAKWQTASTEQHALKIMEKESVSLDDINFFKSQIDMEQRAHSEIETVVNILTHEMMKKVEEMMSKYDKDMEAIDLRIQIMKSNYDSEVDRRLQLEDTYAKHSELINTWLEFKENREKLRLFRLKMNTCAIIVQAWWRGIMVRFELGPYKPKKSRRGRGKKKY